LVLSAFDDLGYLPRSVGRARLVARAQGRARALSALCCSHRLKGGLDDAEAFAPRAAESVGRSLGDEHFLVHIRCMRLLWGLGKSMWNRIFFDFPRCFSGRRRVIEQAEIIRHRPWQAGKKVS
jgi:hypothetical protein